MWHCWVWGCMWFIWACWFLQHWRCCQIIIVLGSTSSGWLWCGDVSMQWLDSGCRDFFRRAGKHIILMCPFFSSWIFYYIIITWRVAFIRRLQVCASLLILSICGNRSRTITAFVIVPHQDKVMVVFMDDVGCCGCWRDVGRNGRRGVWRHDSGAISWCLGPGGLRWDFRRDSRSESWSEWRTRPSVSGRAALEVTEDRGSRLIGRVAPARLFCHALDNSGLYPSIARQRALRDDKQSWVWVTQKFYYMTMQLITMRKCPMNQGCTIGWKFGEFENRCLSADPSMIRYIRDALTDAAFQFSGVHLCKPSVKSVKDVYLLVVGERTDPSMHCDSLSNDPGSILSLVFNQMCDDALLV